LIYKYIVLVLVGEKMSRKEKRKGRRVKYSPEEVVMTILNKPLFYIIAEIVYTSDRPLHASEIARIIKERTGEEINPGYVYNILSKLEKWHVVEPVKDPVNGKLAFRPSNKKVSELLRQEIEKRKAKDVEDIFMRAEVSVE